MTKDQSDQSRQEQLIGTHICRLDLRPVAARAASIKDQTSGAVLHISLTTITVVELVLVARVGVKSIRFASTEAAAT